MSSPANVDQSASKAEHQNCPKSNSNTPVSSVQKHDISSEFRFTPDQNYAPTWPATRPTSHQPSEGSETTMLGGFYDGGKFDSASSVTLRDEFPWHEVRVNKYTKRIPAMIVSALLQGVSDLSPSRSLLDGREGKSREVDEDSDGSEDGVPRYSAGQKGKWKARKDDDVMHNSRWVRSSSPQIRVDSIYINTVEDWFIHNRPILQDYADRQVSLPLGRRLELSIDEPSKFILGAMQLLVNRDRRGCTDHSRQLGPQLIENFVDIDHWAKEYFRSRHGTRVVDNDVSTLLTIVMNNFYEGQVQLIDRLVEFALENMRLCGRSNLDVVDFAFGFDFKMSQDLPFYVETSSQIREPLPIPSVKVRSTPGPVITNSGRRVKPTKRAQAGLEQAQTNASGRRNKGKNTSQVKDKRAANSSVPAARQKKGPAQPPSDCTAPETSLPSQADPRVVAPAPSKTTPEHPKHRSTRPSNLGLPPILPSSSSTPAPGNTRLESNDSCKSKPSASASADSPNAIESSRSKPTVCSSPRLKIILPGLRLPASTTPATSDSGLTLSNTNSSADALGNTNRGRGASRPRGTRPRGPRNGRGRGRERGCRSLTLRAEILEGTPDSTTVLSTTHPVGAGNIVAPATANPPVAHPTLVNGHMGAVGTAAGTRPQGAATSIVTCDDDPSASRRILAGERLLSPNDPDHPQGKKRKLDDCED